MEIAYALGFAAAVVFASIIAALTTNKGEHETEILLIPEEPRKPHETPVEPPPAPAPVVVTPMPQPPPAKPKGVDYGKWPELVKALIKVESEGNDNAIGDRHLKDMAYGCLQIRKPVCIDVNRAYGLSLTPQMMLGNRQLSIDTFYRYMALYATAKQIGREPTDEDRARCWNGGPTGWKRSTTVAYWAKVQKAFHA